MEAEAEEEEVMEVEPVMEEGVGEEEGEEEWVVEEVVERVFGDAVREYREKNGESGEAVQRICEIFVTTVRFLSFRKF